MQSHSREATVAYSVAKLLCYSILLNMQSHFVKYAESQSRSHCYPISLNMQSHSREATVMLRRRGVAASFKVNLVKKISICP